MAGASSEAVDPRIASKADAGIKAAEGVDKNGLAQILNAENIYDRPALARTIQEGVDRDHRANPALPTLELSVKTDQSGKDVLVDVVAGDKNNLYHSDFSESRYSRSFSFGHPTQSIYDTIDPASGRIIAEDVALADGRTSHNTVEYDPTTHKMSAKSWKWSDGMTEHYTYDKNDHEITSDVSWQADGKPHTTHTENKYDTATGLLTETDKTFADGATSQSTFDAKGRMLTQDNLGADGKRFHYSAKYSDKDKLTFEQKLSTEYTEVATYDPDTGAPLTHTSAYSWGAISEEHKYDPTTKKEIYYHRSTSDGSDEVTNWDADGKFLNSVDKRADGKTSHKEATYSGQNLLTADETWFDGSSKHLANTYDPGTGKRVKQTIESQSAKGTSAREVDDFDPDSGHLKSEAFDNADGTKKQITYERADLLSNDQKPIGIELGITETDTGADGISQEHRYIFEYNDSNKAAPKQLLKLKWNGSAPGGQLTSDEERRITQMHWFHIPKAMQ